MFRFSLGESSPTGLSSFNVLHLWLTLDKFSFNFIFWYFAMFFKWIVFAFLNARKLSSSRVLIASLLSIDSSFLSCSSSFDQYWTPLTLSWTLFFVMTVSVISLRPSTNLLAILFRSLSENRLLSFLLTSKMSSRLLLQLSDVL